MRKLTRPEFVYGDLRVGNVLYMNFHPSGRVVTCVAVGEMADGSKVWSEVDAAGNVIYGAQYALCGKGRKENQYFAKVSE